MRTLAITQNITLDGSIDMLEPWFDPADQQDSGMLERVRQESAACDAVLLGRGTFESFRGYWPHQYDDPTGISDHLNRAHKYVVSATLTTPDWENTTIIDSDPVGSVKALKRKPGGDIVLTGSVDLAHLMLNAGVVDEIRLFTYPFVQGRGRRLFPDGFAPTRLVLTQSIAFANGIVYGRWRLG